MNNEMNGSSDQGNTNRSDGRNNERNSRPKKMWEPVASLTPANDDPNFHDSHRRRDVHIQLNRTVPQENGYTVHSVSISRVVEREREDEHGNYIPPRTAPYFGIMTEEIEGKIVPTAGTMQRIQDITDYLNEAVHIACAEKQKEFDARMAARDARQDRADIRLGVQARQAPRQMRKGKTQRDKNRRGGVIVDAPKQPDAHEQEQDQQD